MTFLDISFSWRACSLLFLLSLYTTLIEGHCLPHHQPLSLLSANPSGKVFCSQYLATTDLPLPTYVMGYSTGDVSRACSCFIPTSTTTTTISQPSISATTSPSNVGGSEVTVTSTITVAKASTITVTDYASITIAPSTTSTVTVTNIASVTVTPATATVSATVTTTISATLTTSSSGTPTPTLLAPANFAYVTYNYPFIPTSYSIAPPLTIGYFGQYDIPTFFYTCFNLNPGFAQYLVHSDAAGNMWCLAYNYIPPAAMTATVNQFGAKVVDAWSAYYIY